jgi:protein TonB
MMNANDILSSHLDDIVFESRNKAYGAYVLRKEYDKNIRNGLIIATFLFLMVVFSQIFSDFISSLRGDNMVKEIISTYDFEPPPPTDMKKEMPVQATDVLPPPPPKPSIKYTPPIIKADNEVEEEDATPTIDALRDIAIATKTQDGKQDGVDLGIIDEYGASTEAPPVVEVPKKEEVFTRVEQMPQFGSGERELLEYLAKNIKYPAFARINSIQGTVVIQFIVDKDGSVTEPTVVREVGGGCDEEAIRVIKSMPKWIPGKQQGKPVKVRYTLPVKFKLEN